jgi:hypothetical protein
MDDGVLDLLLDGAPEASLPSDVWDLARLLDAARAPAMDAELAGEAEAIEMFRARPVLRRRRRGRRRAFVIVAGVAVSSFAGAAAAAGRLPDVAQNLASELLGIVGIDVPRADEPAPEDDMDTARPAPRPVGLPIDDPQHFGSGLAASTSPASLQARTSPSSDRGIVAAEASAVPVPVRVPAIVLDAPPTPVAAADPGTLPTPSAQQPSPAAPGEPTSEAAPDAAPGEIPGELPAEPDGEPTSPPPAEPAAEAAGSPPSPHGPPPDVGGRPDRGDHPSPPPTVPATPPSGPPAGVGGGQLGAGGRPPERPGVPVTPPAGGGGNGAPAAPVRPDVGGGPAADAGDRPSPADGKRVTPASPPGSPPGDAPTPGPPGQGH